MNGIKVRENDYRCMNCVDVTTYERDCTPELDAAQRCTYCGSHVTTQEEVEMIKHEGDKLETVITIVTENGATVELEFTTAREIFRRIDNARNLRRAREQFAYFRQQRVIRAELEELGMTWRDGLDLADYYSENLYDPRKFWTCPV